uniref:Deoxyribonuclease TATDN1 n=1 Tax=Strigamia maritima TaxID=126957 RepID=T1ILX7_STRMM
MTAKLRKMIDIGSNLTDPMFKGIYHGSKKHPEDLNQVIDRALQNDVKKIIVTGGSLEESRLALNLARTNEALYCTVGCHPTRCGEFEDDSETYLKDLMNLVENNRDKVVAVGEVGLDYERLEFCDVEKQKKYLKKQLVLSERSKLPLFLHCRKAAMDLCEILRENRDCFEFGVVHSFDGTKQEAKEFLDMGLYIGINGW